MRKLLTLGATAVVFAIAAAVSLTGGLSSAGPQSRAASTPSPSTPSASPTQYTQAVDAAHRHGLRVWIEADLVKRYLAGPDSFRSAVATLAALASRPGVVGIKIADELGYHDGLDSTDKVQSFLSASAAALRAAAPGKLLLIDMIVPELGCLPDHAPPLRWATICAAQQRGMYPQLALSEVDGYLSRHDVDVIDLSTGLLSDRTYSGWGVDTDVAQRTAWQEVGKRHWDQLVRVQARKALAHPGSYGDPASAAQASLTTFVDIPRIQGAGAVDVWTWRQLYQGQIYRLLDPGLQDNSLWEALLERRAGGAVLFTHLSPSSLEVGLDADLAVMANVFTDLFVAAGTG